MGRIVAPGEGCFLWQGLFVRSAQQATDALIAIKRFLFTGANLTHVDADEAHGVLRGLHLPFERLVRNVWVEGPEVAYDVAKAGLEQVLAEESARVKAEKAWLAKQVDGYGPRPLVQQLVHDIGAESRRRRAQPARGPRVGLLTFLGANSNKMPARVRYAPTS